MVVKMYAPAEIFTPKGSYFSAQDKRSAVLGRVIIMSQTPTGFHKQRRLDVGGFIRACACTRYL